jgi:hypothetical protein
VGQGKTPSAPAGEPIEEEAAPAWPGEAEEASFLSGERVQSANGAAPAGSPAGLPPPETTPPIDTAEVADISQPPPLEELVQRIPSEIREALEELFRAKFTRATRVRVSEKKAGPA